ncbi:MAG: hypothetical protein AB1483_12105 [Candidatus Zixiibacteriota bacterium]
MIKDRIACVLVPDLAMQICCLKDPSLESKPVVLTETDSELSLVLAANNIAKNDGVTIDMTVAQARSYCPELVTCQVSRKTERAASEKLRNILFTASPLVEETGAGCFFVDASGLKWLYKTEDDLAKRLVSLISSLKLRVQVGIGNNKFVAHVASLVSPVNSFTVVAADAERRFLNNLAIGYLPLSDDMRDKFLALGLKTIGQVAAFPSNEMTTRFGEEGAKIARLSKGDDTDFFLPEFSQVLLSARASLFDPLESSGEIVFHVNKILTDLLEKLGKTGRGCKAVDVQLHLETDGQMRIPLQRDRAHTGIKTLHLVLKKVTEMPFKFIRLLNEQLNGLRLSGRVADITITIPEVLPLESSQLELLGASGFHHRQMGTSAGHKMQVGTSDGHKMQMMGTSAGHKIQVGTSAGHKIQMRTSDGHNVSDGHIVGNQHQIQLLAPAVGDGITPDSNCSFCAIDSKPKSKNTAVDTSWRCSFALNPIAGLRLIQPARKATVASCGAKLSSVRLRHHTRSIVRQNGPWELSGGWWQYGFDRMYYEVQTDDDRFYLLYFDRQASDWYVQGVFD